MKKMMLILCSLGLMSASAFAAATQTSAEDASQQLSQYISVLKHSGSNCYVWASMLGVPLPANYEAADITDISIMAPDTSQLAQFSINPGESTYVSVAGDSITVSDSLIPRSSSSEGTDNLSGTITIDRATNTVTISQPHQRAVSCTVSNLMLSEDPNAGTSGPQF